MQGKTSKCHSLDDPLVRGKAHAKVVQMGLPKAIEEAESQDSNLRAIEKAGIFIPASYGV